MNQRYAARVIDDSVPTQSKSFSSIQVTNQMAFVPALKDLMMPASHGCK